MPPELRKALFSACHNREEKCSFVYVIRDKKSVILYMLPVIRKVYVMHATKDRKSAILCIPLEIRKVLLYACHNREEKCHLMDVIRNEKLQWQASDENFLISYYMHKQYIYFL